MKRHQIRWIAWIIPVCILTCISMQLQAEEKSSYKEEETAKTEAESPSEQVQSVQAEVDDEAGKTIARKRGKIIQEAMDAVEQTRKALAALEEEDTEKAMTALERAVGKLELLVAREPSLALAPQNVTVVTYDLFATPEEVTSRIREAERFLDDGKVQEARHILSFLASEIRVQTSNIPLATYPQAIKSAVPLVDDGKIDEAKNRLQSALNTLVITEQIIPLPVMRARALLVTAENLAEDDSRTVKQNEELADMLDETRNQIELAQALGYGEKKMFKSVYREIDAIEEKTQEGKSGTGFFDKLKKAISGF